jgi:hypothetical protein
MHGRRQHGTHNGSKSQGHIKHDRFGARYRGGVMVLSTRWYVPRRSSPWYGDRGLAVTMELSMFEKRVKANIVSMQRAGKDISMG